MKKIIIFVLAVLISALIVVVVINSKNESNLTNKSGDTNKVEVVVNQNARNLFIFELEDMINNYEEKAKAGTIDFAAGDDFSDNQFAICDIDNDGKEELIIKYETASMAGMFLGVFKYNEQDDTLYKEVMVAPNARFYKNGVIISEWLHNQGPSLSIWPYTAYKYNAQTDEYDMVGQVYSWNKYGGDSGERIDFSVDYDGTKFPDDVDQDRDEVVYMVEEKYVDEAEFNKYENNLYKDSKEIDVPFVSFTQVNIDKLKK